MCKLNLGRGRKAKRDGRQCDVEALETRTLLSAAATAQLTLLTTANSGGSIVYSYDISVTDTGTSNVGTFWFAWQPNQDYLPTLPSAITSPTGWSGTITGTNNSTDGSAIEWLAGSNAITPNQTLDGFKFSSIDSPTALAGDSPTHPGTPVMTSEIYAGGALVDPEFEFAVTPAVSPAVASTTTLVSSEPAADVGDSITLTATVASASGSGVTPTGTVDFTQDGNDLGTVNVASDGTAALVTSALPIGTDHITASYSGDSNYAVSASAPLTQTVSPPANAVTTTTAVTSPNLAAVSGAAVTFTATITPATTGAAPTGTVSFTSGGIAIGSGRVQSDGTATLTVSSLPVGGDTIVATYTGDINYAASTSPSIVETISLPPTLVPVITKTTLPASIAADTAVHGTVTLSITNDTATLIKGKGTLAIFASTGNSIDGSAISLGQISHALSVKTTGPTSVSVPLKLSASLLPAGSYTLFARVIDPASNQTDSIAGPTVVVAPAFIALSETVTKSTVPTSGASGAKAHGSAVLSITNNGNITMPGTTTAALFATTAGVVDQTAKLISTITKPLHIKAGKSGNFAIPVKLFPTLVVGSYTVVAQVSDPNGTLTSVTVGTLTITA